ncbi:carbohydrate ABC transporter permease [Radiobacillus sp. PE A8.2]|uniref:carbohydrate ABC transporter permease n=1 Tax=Radiobacillus sp. PE A8.2 TaxID=3380349 RepID=UPI00388DA8F8
MKEKKAYQVIVNIALLYVTLIMILPLVLLFINSITDENTLIANGYSFFPSKLSLDAYEYIATNFSTIGRAYGISIIATATGTFVGLLITSMMAFSLSIRKLPGTRIISFFVFFTMLFNGGLMPTYVVWTSLGIVDTIWAYILPFWLSNAFNIILVRSYFATSIPEELYESAKMDGAGYFRIFFTMAIPLGKPILVTVGLFSLLLYWNDWQNGLYFITDPQMLSIQALLNKMNQNLQAVLQNATYSSSGDIQNLPAVSIRMAIAFVAMLPILVMYPFLQKHFTSGVMGGAVKG